MAAGTHGSKFKTAVTSNGCPIHSVFGSSVGFSGSADPLALLPAVMLEDFKCILAMGHQVHFIFCAMPGFLADQVAVVIFGISALSTLHVDWLQCKIFLLVLNFSRCVLCS